MCVMQGGVPTLDLYGIHCTPPPLPYCQALRSVACTKELMCTLFGRCWYWDSVLIPERGKVPKCSPGRHTLYIEIQGIVSSHLMVAIIKGNHSIKIPRQEKTTTHSSAGGGYAN